jgi:hypothetical protein
VSERVPTPFVPRFDVRHRVQQAAENAAGAPAPQFDIKYHAALTEQACPDDPPVKDELSVIVAANAATDLDQFDSALHFDNCAFGPGIERIDDLWQLIASRDLEINRFVLFGTMIHTVQDFYAHSNWIELHVNQRPVAVWNLELSFLPSSIVSGTFLLDSPKLCGPDAPTHAQLNKDSPQSREGSKTVDSGPNQGRTLFDLAYTTALEATRQQFSRLVDTLPPA